MGHYEIGAHLEISKKGKLLSVNLWENNQFRTTIVNKLELTNYYLRRSNNSNSLAVCDYYSVLVSTVTKV